MNNRKYWLLGVLTVLLITIYLISSLEKEMSKVEVLSVEEVLEERTVTDFSDDLSEWDFDDDRGFFAEYRMERDRVRSQELEMLNEMINNNQVGDETRQEAEDQIMKLVDTMEKELLVENMLKAQGYRDALLFYREQTATVMVESEKLLEEDFMNIAEMVSSITGVPREQVQVIQNR